MTRPLEPGQMLGESEFGLGPGMFPHPDLDFSRGDTPIPSGEGTRDLYQQKVAELRTDTTDPDSTPDLFVKGNPDRHGRAPALVRGKGTVTPSTIDVNAPGGVKGAKLKTGVTREGDD